MKHVLVVLLLCTGTLGAKADDDPLFSFDLAASAVYDSNVNNGDDESRSDKFASVSGKVIYQHLLGPLSALQFQAAVEAERYDRYDGLDNETVGGKLSYNVLSGRGFFAPAYTVFASVTEKFSESEIRDSTTGVLGADVSKWLTSKVNVTGGIDVTVQQAEGTVFDTDSARVFVNLDYLLQSNTILYSTAAFIYGDTVSTGPPSLDAINEADAIELDDAFGGDKVVPNQLAYRLEAKTAVLTIGANIPLTNTLSLDISVRGIHADADGNNEYDRGIASISLFGRF